MWLYKHPEQMTPGSFWKVRGEEGWELIEPEEEGHYSISKGQRTYHPPKERKFDLITAFFLVEFKEEKNTGMVDAKFLKGDDIIEICLYGSFWDQGFELVQETVNPKEIETNNLLFGRYPLDELSKKLGLAKEK